jgi:hypothetical protein
MYILKFNATCRLGTTALDYIEKIVYKFVHKIFFVANKKEKNY